MILRFSPLDILVSFESEKFRREFPCTEKVGYVGKGGAFLVDAVYAEEARTHTHARIRLSAKVSRSRPHNDARVCVCVYKYNRTHLDIYL